MSKCIAPLFGLTHSLETGSMRIVEGLTGEALKSGIFCASREDTLTGPVVGQSTIFPDLGNQTFQNDADEAIHRLPSRIESRPVSPGDGHFDADAVSHNDWE